jgi:hypothetical protein
MRKIPAGTVLLLLIVFVAVGRQAQAQGAQVAILGCVSTGLQPSCLIITDKASGKSYQLNAAKPKPDPARHLVVRLTGTVTDKVDLCMQGPVLEKISWTYMRMKCGSADQ